jgi:hypothetical protein
MSDTPKHAGGRPLKFKTPEELQERIDAYFADCDPHPELVTYYEWHQKESGQVGKDGKPFMVNDQSKPPMTKTKWDMTDQKPYTITGLAVFLGTSRQTLINYQDKDGQFFDTIKGAKDRIENFWEKELLGAHATGPIFNLKNNYEWKDKTEQEVKHGGDVQFVNVVPRPKKDAS